MSLVHPFSQSTLSVPRDNDLSESRFLMHSHRVNDYHEIPELTKEAFHYKAPLQQFYEDKARLHPVSYQCPDYHLIERDFSVVDENISYGVPMTPEQFTTYRTIHRQDPEVITYGWDEIKTNKRVKIEVKEEGKKDEVCCGNCCGVSEATKAAKAN